MSAKCEINPPLTASALARIIFDAQCMVLYSLKGEEPKFWDTLNQKTRWELIEEIEFNLPYGPTDPKTILHRTESWRVSKGIIPKIVFHYDKLDVTKKLLVDLYNQILNNLRYQVVKDTVTNEDSDTCQIPLSLPVS